MNVTEGQFIYLYLSFSRNSINPLKRVKWSTESSLTPAYMTNSLMEDTTILIYALMKDISIPPPNSLKKYSVPQNSLMKYSIPPNSLMKDLTPTISFIKDYLTPTKTLMKDSLTLNSLIKNSLTPTKSLVKDSLTRISLIKDPLPPTNSFRKDSPRSPASLTNR